MPHSLDRIPAGWLRILVDTVPSLIFIKGEDGRYLLVNEALARFLGTTVGQMTGRSEHDFNIAPSAEQWEALLRQDRDLMRTRTATEIEVQLRAADGQLRWFKTAKVPLANDDGSCDRLLFVSTDITDRRLAEAAAGESQHMVRRVLDTTPNLIYIYDLVERRNVYANREVTDFLGYTTDQIRAMGPALFERILHPDDAEGVAAHHARCAAAKDEEVLEVEYRMRHATGEWRWLHSRDTVFSRAADGAVRQILGSTADMTEQKRFDAERRDLEAQLVQSQKMEAVGRLAGRDSRRGRPRGRPDAAAAGVQPQAGAPADRDRPERGHHRDREDADPPQVGGGSRRTADNWSRCWSTSRSTRATRCRTAVA